MSNIWKDRNYSKDFYEDYLNDYCFEYITINKLDSNFLLYSINKYIIEDNIYDISLEFIRIFDCSKENKDKDFLVMYDIKNNQTLDCISVNMEFHVDCGWNVYGIKILEIDYTNGCDKFMFDSLTNYISDIFKEHVEEMLQIKKKHCNEVVKEYKSVLSRLSR